MKINLGTRKSPMAYAVAQRAKQKIIKACPEISSVSIHQFTSDGDRFLGDLSKIGGKGAFVKNLELQLLNGKIDIAIHALKDIPTDIPMHKKLTLVSFLEREDPRDAIISRSGIDFSDIATIGTSSPRRVAIAKRLFPSVSVRSCRGNVNTRLTKLDEEHFDALILAKSGLERLGFENRITKTLELHESLPAAGQGTCVLQIHKDNSELAELISRTCDTITKTVSYVEREFLTHLNGNCFSAISAYANFKDSKSICLKACLYAPTEKICYSGEETRKLDDIENLGRDLAVKLLDDAGVNKW